MSTVYENSVETWRLYIRKIWMKQCIAWAFTVLESLKVYTIFNVLPKIVVIHN